MFPLRYFPIRYCAPRYFPKIGATPSAGDAGSTFIGLFRSMFKGMR